MTPNAPIRSGSRFDHEGDEAALHFFSEEDRRLSPEEYIARHAHLIDCFALHFYRYRDPTLGAWVRRVGELFDTDGEPERCRQRFLSQEECAAIREQGNEL